jgi:hypothetical protein
VAENLRNLRQARTAERTHNNHGSRYPAGERTAARSYRGSHRSERRHRADDQRNSRVGHHHSHHQGADHRDQPSRW